MGAILDDGLVQGGGINQAQFQQDIPQADVRLPLLFQGLM